MTAFQLESLLCAGCIVVLMGAWLLRDRFSQWRRTRWMRRPPRTGAFHASTVKLAIKLLLPLSLFLCAVAAWCLLTPWLSHVNRYAAGLAVLFGAIPAHMGFAAWAGPGKLAARHLRVFKGIPLVRLDEDGFRYLSFAHVSWRDVHQIQYLSREEVGGRSGPVLAILLQDATHPLRTGEPVDIWAHDRYTSEICRWTAVNAGQWMLLDLRLLAGASVEHVAFWMMSLRQTALR